jgi:hypothetical protein
MAAGALAFQRIGREELTSEHKTKFQKEHGCHTSRPLRWLTLRSHTSFWPERAENQFFVSMVCLHVCFNPIKSRKLFPFFSVLFWCYKNMENYVDIE